MDYAAECLPQEQSTPSCAGRCSGSLTLDAYELAAAAQPIPGGGYCYCDPACDNDYTDNNSHGGCCADHAWRCSKDGERDPLCMDARTQAQAVNAFVAHHVVAALMNHTTASASDSEVVVLGT